VIKYNELVGKMKNEPKYKEFENDFEKESKKEVEPGVAANKELADLGDPTPERIANPKTDKKDEKLVKKARFKAIRELRGKVIKRKGEIIELIEKKLTPEIPEIDLTQLRTQAITDIQDELNKPPKVEDSDLVSYSD
jgi:hypothetical protein